MRLIRLELNGFKSFAKKTELAFGDGITAVIGPNGSGKSNIADAVRWVLGEQNARALRGARMEDVIFSGTQQRRAQAYCEVTLTFDNADGLLHVPFSEVAVTRRVYRSGESEYCINRSPCRLRDIVEMFRDTGVGRDGYSIIGQGRVDEILANKSNERRAALEEAAGIMRYRVRKEEAERKLEHAGKNLERLEDILSELHGRLEPLEKQSAEARAYLKLRDELRDLEINLFLYRHARGQERLAALEETLGQLSGEQAQGEEQAAAAQQEAAALAQRLSEQDAALSKRRGELLAARSGAEARAGEYNVLLERRERVRAERAAAVEARDALLARRDELGATIETMASGAAASAAQEQLARDVAAAQDALAAQDEALLAQERALEERKSALMEAMNRLADARSGLSRFDAMAASITARMDELRAQQAERAAADGALEQEFDEAQNALAALAAAREEAQQRLDEAQQRRAQLDEKHSEAENARRALEQEAEAARSRLRVLSEMARSREGYQASVRSLMADAARDGRLGAAVTGVVAELIHVPARFETAVTMALGGALQNIVTPTAEDARYVIEYLRQKEYGRATLLPLSLLHSTPASARERALLSDAEGCFGLASELISCDAALRPVAEYLLGRTAVVEDLGAGLRLKKRTGGAFHIATLEGDIISTGGAMSGGSRQKRAPSLLGREREIKELREAVRQKEERLSELSKTCEALSRDLMLAGLQAEAFRSQLHEQELALARQKEKADIIARDRARSAGEGERLAQELQRLSDNLADAGRQREEATALERDIETGNAATREDVQRAQAELTQQRARREAASQALTEQKVRLMALQKERDAVEAERRRLQAEHEQACRAIGRQDEAIARADGQLAAAGERIEALRQSVEQQQRAADEQQREQDRLEQARAACAASLEQARQRREQALEALRDVGERRHRQELQKSRAEMELAAMQDRMWEEYELTYENALPLRHEIAPGPAAARVRAVRDEMHAMGDVNLSSIEEYRAVAERHEALDRQCADLRRAREDLERLVAELTGTMQSEFRRQFDVIQENFGRVFAELFGGGHAELRLSDSGDVLGCDIDIIAQPPGKKLQLLSLLSGGERALTTIALLFALLQLKPPAFCILDEIESSLDEVNVSRFAEYLRSYSGKTQFILITHRKGSMEVCDALYGVSMEERGVSKVVSARFGGAAG